MIELVPFDKNFLDLSYNWLTDPDVKYLTNTPDITKEGQRVWFESLPNRSDYLVMGVCEAGMPIGVCGLKHINNGSCEYFGYIGEKNLWGGGRGTFMMKEIEQEALIYGVQRMWLWVLKSNTRAINLYRKMQYVIVEETDNKYKMEKFLNSSNDKYLI